MCTGIWWELTETSKNKEVQYLFCALCQKNDNPRPSSAVRPWPDPLFWPKMVLAGLRLS